MDFWEDIRFKKYPKKIFLVIVAILILGSVIAGIVHRDAKKGASFYFDGMKYVTKPLVNYAIHRGEKVGELFEKVVEKVFKNVQEQDQNP